MKKLSFVNLLLGMVLLLSACGTSAPNTANSTTQPNTPPASTSAPDASATPDASAAQATTVPDASDAAATTVAEPAEEPTAVLLQAPPPAEGKTQIIWWTENTQDPEQQAIKTLFAESFMAAHPEIDLQIVFQPDLGTAQRTAIQAGAGPDIIQTSGPTDIAEYIEPGFVAPLDAYAQQYNWADKVLPWALDVGKQDGKLYSLPLTYETLVLFYNKKVFADNNIQPPTNRAELEAIATALKAKGISPFANAQSNGFIMPVLYSNYAGADTVYKGLLGEVPWNDPLLVEPVSIFNDYMQRGWFSGDKETYFSTDYTTSFSNFQAGKGAMMIMGTWAFRQLNDTFKDNPQDWDWVPFPSLRQGVSPAYALGIGSTISISAQSKHPEVAAQVIDWVYNDPKRAAQIIQAVPGEWVVPINLSKSDFPAETDPRFVRALETIAETSQKGDYSYVPWTFWPPQTADLIYGDLDTVFTGELTPEAWSQLVQETFAEELSNGKVPPIPSR